MGLDSGELGQAGLASGTELASEALRSRSGPPGGMATPEEEDHCSAAVEAREQDQGSGMQEYVGVRQAGLTPSVVLAALGDLGQGWAELRAQGLEGVGWGQGLRASVDYSPPPLYGLLAWGQAATSC